jgi:hypothetical protein
MGINLNTAGESGKAAGAAINDLDQQRLRILRCTAHAMASSPGGLRFQAGTRPWLDGLPVGLSASSRRRRLCSDAQAQSAAN